MPPAADISSFTDEQKRLFSQAASLGSGVNVTNNGQSQIVAAPTPMTPGGLTGTEKPLVVSPYVPPPVPDTTDIDKLISSFDTPSAEQKTAEENKTSLIQSIKDLLTKQGTESARKAELETAAGIPDLNKTLNELVNNIRQNNAGAFAATQQQEDRLAPTFAIQGSQAQIERQRAVKNYGLAAAAEAVQGNIALANSNIERALDAEFGPLESQLEFQKFLYDTNRDELERADRKQADKLAAANAERSRILEEQKANKASIYGIATTIAKYGVDASVVQRVLAAETAEDALTLASPYLTDPKAKYELESMRLDTLLKKEQILKTQRESLLVGQPTAAELKAEREALKKAESTVPVLQKKLDTLEALKTHPGMAGTVGAYGVARWTPFTIDKADKQDFIGSVEQLTNQETLDTLVNLKAQGGTLGATNAQEFGTLRDAATKINNWAIRDDNGKVTGYAIDEATFKKELDALSQSTQRLMWSLQGSLFSPEEQALLDSATGGINSFDPSF